MTAIDAHVHVWDLPSGPVGSGSGGGSGGGSGVDYSWLTGSTAPDLDPLRRSFRLADLEPHLDTAGVDGIVLVQAADSLAETDELLRVAAGSVRPAAVVGWLPLADAAATARELDARSPASTLVGVRHLIHDEPDTRWLLRDDVAAGMRILEHRGLTFDAVAERPDLLAQVPVVARRHPELTIVVDHLGKPPIAAGDWQPWADLLSAAAAEPNVVGKVSGLNTASAARWQASDWQRYVDHAIDVFGPERLMLGGDWPVALLAGTYAEVWNALLTTISTLGAGERAAVTAATAQRVYRLPKRSAAP